MGWLISCLCATFIVALIVYADYRKGVKVAQAAAAKPAAPPATPKVGEPTGPQTIIEKLQALAGPLDDQSNRTAHPRDLIGFADFQKAVALLMQPDCDLATVRQFALGRIWELSCAAFEALSARPDRQEMLAPTMSALRTFSPGALHFVLRYLDSLQTRPVIGDTLSVAQSWWTDRSMAAESYRESFERRAALGDTPVFGDALKGAEVDIEGIDAFLASIDHPMVAPLRAALKQWREARIDERALTAFGRFWTFPQEELLVEPEPWLPALALAEAAVTSARPRSILVTGGPRIGKSGFLRLLGDRLAAKGWRVFDAAVADLMADQSYFGQLEGRIRLTVTELEAGKKVVWCVGDLQQLSRSGTHQGQAASVLDQIGPAMAAGRLLILAEADPDGASRTLQARPSLRSHLEVVRLTAFDDAELTAFAGVVAGALESRRGLAIDAAARDAAIHYGQQYLRAADAPGLVADVLKRAAERATAPGRLPAKAKGRVAVTALHVIEAVAQLTGLPPDILNEDDPIDLAAVRAFFAHRVMGQDHAIAVVVDRIAMLKAGLVDPGKPIGVFLFAGPTGTGKTELAKTLADFLFGSPERLVRLDMSEFQSAETVSKIVGERGAPAGGDPLVERIRKQPFSVVLLDEFEKAHSNVWDLFLQVFDDGRLTDANGHTVDFRHTIIILTSNLGATSHRSSGMGFGQSKDVFGESQVTAAIQRAFRPEFVNRLDRIVVFKPLSRALLYQILRKELADVLGRRGLRSREWAVEWEPSALDFLLDKGFSPELGARPLKRAIDQYLLAPLAATLVEHRFPEGDQFLFVRSNGAAIEVEFLDPNSDSVPAQAATTAATPTEQPKTAAGLTLPGLILRPSAEAPARDFLRARQQQLDDQLTGPDWTALKSSLAEAAADPQIWSRPDRAAVFATLGLTDRVREAADTVGRLARRLGSGFAKGDAAARDLAARLALHLWLVEAGVGDALAGAPPDAILAIDAPMEGGDAGDQAAWSRRLMAMYVAWAERRRMQFRLSTPKDGGAPILVVSGFGAFRTLAAEAGLHVLEFVEGETARRVVARVRVAEEPQEEGPPQQAHRRLAAALDAAGAGREVIRNYRDGPGPLVRDRVTGRRSGQLEVVLGGDFDLVFAP